MGWGDAGTPAPPRADGGGAPNCAVAKCGCTSIGYLVVRSLEFVNDHGLLHDYETDFRRSGRKFRKPEWGKGDAAPVSYSMDQSIEIWLTFEVGPENACPDTGDLVGEGPHGIFFEARNYTFKPGTNRVFMIARKALAKKVQILDFLVNWRTEKLGADFIQLMDFTQNRIYVTYDKPYRTTLPNTVTVKRLEWLCSLTSGDTNGHDSVQKIHEKGGKYKPGAPKPDDPWVVAGGVRCECVDLSKFYMLATQMLGLKTGKVVFLFPTPGKGTDESEESTKWTRRDVVSTHPPAKHIHGTDRPVEKLVFLDGHMVWNNYEACFKFEHPDRTGRMKTRYYAGGAKAYDTAVQVMANVCSLTQWTYYFDMRDVNMGAGENICNDPGPYPVDRWI